VELEVEGVRPKTLDEVGGVQVVQAVAEVVAVDVVGGGDVAAALIAADRPFG
jgi:3-phosphoglycerate kinase